MNTGRVDCFDKIISLMVFLSLSLSLALGDFHLGVDLFLK